MSLDRETVDLYDSSASEFAAFQKDHETGWLSRFSALLPAGGAALDFGCGSGWAAAALARGGFDVTATDASAGLARIAEEAGVKVRVEPFDAMEDVALYDGVWASFSLLHAPRDAMPDLLGRVHRALRPGGALYIGLKAGAGESRDKLGRFYTYYEADEIEGLLSDAGFTVLELEMGEGPGFSGDVSRTLEMLARRN